MKSHLVRYVILVDLFLRIAEISNAGTSEPVNNYFSPKGGSEVRLDPVELSHSKSVKNHHYLRGFIDVLPPKGSCLIVQRNKHIEDVRVCKKTRLSFRLMDIGTDGRITWTISTGPHDFGQPVWWQTPYLIGKIVDYTMPWPGQSVAIYLKECTIKEKNNKTQRIVLDLIPAKQWDIRIPVRETLAPQPDKDKPNLYIQESTFASGFVKVEKKKTEDSAADPLSKTGEKSKDPNTILSSWQIHPRNSYTLPTNSFLTGQSGSRSGLCRYRYSGYEYKPDLAVIECHKLSEYQWIYMPLPCLK